MWCLGTCAISSLRWLSQRGGSCNSQGTPGDGKERPKVIGFLLSGQGLLLCHGIRSFFGAAGVDYWCSRWENCTLADNNIWSKQYIYHMTIHCRLFECNTCTLYMWCEKFVNFMYMFHLLLYMIMYVNHTCIAYTVPYAHKICKVFTYQCC